MDEHLQQALKDANLSIQYTRVHSGEVQTLEVAAHEPVCTCYVTPTRYWTWVGHIVDPASQMEMNPTCYVHNAAEAPYYNDPLNTTIPVPWSAITVCDCPEMAEHQPECLHSTIFGRVVSEQDFDPRWRWPMDPWGEGARLRTVCCGRNYLDPERSLSWHTLGEINGQTHWCERERRVVNEGE